jgi:subtilisin family serine protease
MNVLFALFISFGISLGFADELILTTGPQSEPIIEVEQTSRFLVELQGTPLLKKMEESKISRADRTSQLKMREELRITRELFKKDFLSLPESDGIKPKVLFEYDLTLHAVSVEVDPELVSRVAKLRNVTRIHSVGKVSIPRTDWGEVVSKESVNEDWLPELNVGEVWSKHGLNGSGITIAVVDTGIDYTHPDLGGCIGAGCKVLGGYDVANNDADPMDDHMHGTHVAGIAAGDGLKKGVAPKAKLYAFKVLSAGGSGTWDQVIRGLEMALDPNSDGSVEDAVQVMNFSLGGRGSPDSPLARAVNSASQMSVIVCAAGNSAKYAPVGTPAAALHSIAVGASNGGKAMANFSSFGPTSGFTLKPDISAPGVNVLSTVPGGAYRKASGTSMASPYMAGMTALLLQHTSGAAVAVTVRTDYLKGRLAVTASPIAFAGESTASATDKYFVRGQGLVNPLAAVENGFGVYLRRNLETVISGFSPDLGVEILSSKYLSRRIIVPFAGKFPPGKSYAVSVSHGLGEGAIVDYWPKRIDANNSSVIMSIRQPTASIPKNKQYPHSR